MALAHAILVILKEAPHSGYDLAKCFAEKGGTSPVGCFWQASQQQIYRELNKMEHEGWVDVETIIQEGRPNKKLYQITALGLQQLLEWMQEPSEPTAIREDLLVKLLGAHLVDRLLIQTEIERRRQLHVSQLQAYQVLEQSFQEQQHPSLQDRFQYMTLRRGIHYEADWVDWCDEALEVLKDMAADDS